MQYLLLSTLKGKVLVGAIIGALAWGVGFALYSGSLLESYELRTYDQLCRFKANYSSSPQEIVLVAVDQGSLEAARSQGINWPWPRQMYAPILQFCAAAGARAVVFDILFTEPSSYGLEDDRVFADAVKETGRTVLALFLARQEHPHPEGETALIRKNAFPLRDESGQARSPFLSSILPIQPLAGNAYGLGNVATFPDPDGIYRRVPIVFFYQESWIPSLGLAVFRDLALKNPAVLDDDGLRLDGRLLPLDQRSSFLLHYYGNPGFPRFSAFNVIQSSVALQEGGKPVYAPEVFRDKIVFVGYTAPGLFDLKPTPTSSRTPGTVIHATVAANILHGDFRVRISPYFALALALGFAAAVAVAVMVIPTLWLLAVVVLVCAGAIISVVLLFFWQDVWLDGVLLAFSSALSFAMSTAFNYATEGRQRRQIKDMFSRYMSDLLIQDLLKNPGKLRLGGERKVLTVLFSDLAGFTSISEKLSPEEVVTLLNLYLTAMTDIILASGGIIDKYEGDAIMAFWGAPVQEEDHAARACLAALENQTRLATLRQELAQMGLPPVYSRIGINTGEMIIGNLGSSQRFDFTVIGDSVNLASRLEGAGKEYGTSILISEETYRRAREAVEVRELDLLQVKGKELPVRIYELLGKRGGLDEKKKELIRTFAEALALYRAQDWTGAIATFRRCLEVAPEDGPSKIFIRRCEVFQQNPLPPGWDGVFRLTSK